MRITKETHAPAQSTIFPPETTAPSTEQGEETGTALALIGTQPAALIYAPGVLAGLVERIKSEVRNELATLDVSRPKDKARIISLAAKVASAKVSLDDAGKALGEEARKQIDAINADRKWMRDELDPFKIEVRKPVTDLENAEKERVAALEAALASIPESADYGRNECPAEIRERLVYLSGLYSTRDWNEFSKRAEQTISAEIAHMGDLLAAAEKREADALELIRLRAEAAERAIKEREEAAALAAKQAAERKAEEQARLAREATEAEQRRIENERIQAEARAKQAEAEKIEAEQRAARELQEAEERRKREAEQAEARAKQAEAEKIEAEQRAARELQEAEDRRKREAEQAEARRIADAEAAKRREEEAAEQAKRDQEAAIEAERQRVAAEKRRELEEAEKRAKNRAHLASINREVLADLVALGASEEFGKVLIEGIVKGGVRHTTIAY